jgi:hypothetical protein
MPPHQPARSLISQATVHAWNLINNPRCNPHKPRTHAKNACDETTRRVCSSTFYVGRGPDMTAESLCCWECRGRSLDRTPLFCVLGTTACSTRSHTRSNVAMVHNPESRTGSAGPRPRANVRPSLLLARPAGPPKSMAETSSFIMTHCSLKTKTKKLITSTPYIIDEEHRQFYRHLRDYERWVG